MAIDLMTISDSERARFMRLLTDQRAALAREAAAAAVKAEHNFILLAQAMVCSKCDIAQSNARAAGMTQCDGRPAIGKAHTQGARDWWAGRR